MSKINRFNIRVYGLLLNESRTSILVSDELIRGKWYTKFPGGGLEYGESTLECLQREAIEELGQPVEVIKHFYTTDIFVQSAFKEEDQILAVYYTCKFAELSNSEYDPTQSVSPASFDEQQNLRWLSMHDLKESDFDFPTDKKVVAMLKQGI